MFARYLPQPWRQRQPLAKLLDAVLLFAALLVAVWLATQRREAPELILLLLLFVITSNFSLPYRFGAVGLVPVVSVTALLLLDWRTALLVTFAGLLLAELARPLWQPVWQSLDLAPPGFAERLALLFTYMSALFAAAVVYAYLGGSKPPSFLDLGQIRIFTLSILAYAAVHYLLLLLFSRFIALPLPQLLAQTPAILAATLLAQALALFGATALALGGLPVFVIYAFSIVLIAILLWLTWQRRYVLEQRLLQLAVLNSEAASLRETLELEVVLRRACQTVARLLPAAFYEVALQDENGRWQHRVRLDAGGTMAVLDDANVDNFTIWVARQGRALELNEQNMHFAARHNLQPPHPRPSAWLGVPLQTGNRTIGVLVAQRHAPGRPFNRWSREVLLAVAGQASAAVDNARLYSETLRLYNLSDEALARRLRQLQALLNTMQEGVLLLDPAGRVVLVNTMAAHLLGRPAAAIRDQQLDLAASAPCLGYTRDNLQLRLARLANQTEVAAAANPDGEPFIYGEPADAGVAPRYLERTEATVLGHDDRLIGLLMLFRDVSEERALAEQRADLVRMIVHDLRNPVSTFISNMNLVAGMLPAADESMLPVRHAVADARESGLDMLDMVDSLLDVNRLEAGELVLEVEALNLAAIADRALQRLRVLAEKREIHLSRHAVPDLPPAWADEEIVRRVMVNLLDNALKFTPSGGCVHCEFLAEPSLTHEREPGVRCVVSDTGPGVPPADRDKIFERYMRTNEGGAQVRGTGLGLAFCKLAVEAHGGRIWVENHAGGGSKFIFTLPGVPRLPEAL